jgi:ABC-type multidrug transport system fused ATPase/permease subunit
MTKFLSKFWYVTEGKHRALIGMACLFLLISGMEMLGTGLIGPFIAVVTNPEVISQNYWLNAVYSSLGLHSGKQFLLVLGLLVIVAFYVKAFLSFMAQKAVFEFGYSLKGKLSCRLMTAYLSAPYTYHLTKNSATLIQNMVTLTDQFCIGLVMPLLTSVSNSIVILALIILLVWTNALASILIAGMLVVAFALLKPLKHRLARWGKEGYEASVEMVRTLNHGLGGLKETRIIGCETHFEEQMQEQSKRYAKNQSLVTGYSNLPRYAIEASLISFLVCFALLFVTFSQDGQSLSAVLGVFAIASIRMLPATANLVTGINVIRSSIHSLDGLSLEFRELETVKALKASPAQFSNRVLQFKEEVVVDEIVYRYSSSTKNVLDGISLTIKKGESIGLIGKSGSGKTTLVDLLMGLLLPQHGDIRVDGVSVYNDLRSWQNLIGYVPQSIFLIDDTLERNIAFGVPDHLIDQDKLDRAIQAAQLTEVISQLPNGVKTNVGERGVLLSGGQRQRVGIARTLYHGREILVFDEATAALDNETEYLVTEAIKALAGSKTIIIIAHRLTTIEHCDRIYRIDQGRVAESGSYQKVVLEQ